MVAWKVALSTDELQVVIALCYRHFLYLYLCFAQSNDTISVSTISNHVIFPVPQMQLAQSSNRVGSAPQGELWGG